MTDRIHSFPPVADGAARLLILGTMPSAASLEQGFYYAHPRNCFWPMLAEILGEGAPDTVEAKRALILRHHIALWDVAHSCVRPGSLDGDIRDAAPNDIVALLARNPDIRAVLLNGGTAARLYNRLLPELRGRLRTYHLPSTSPAYTLSVARKRAAWSAAIKEVSP